MNGLAKRTNLDFGPWRWAKAKAMADLKAGTLVEICPYPKDRKVSYDSLQGYDGCVGVVELLAGYGDQRKARVIVKSKNGDLAGTKFFPTKALKILPPEKQNPTKGNA